MDDTETTILEDSTLQDTPDTPRCEGTAHDSQEEEEASTSEQAPSNDHKEKNKKGKSSMKSKEKRPHLKLPKALHRSFSAQSNGNQQAKAISVAVFLVEKVGRLLNLEYGKDTTAGLICKMMVENLTMSSQAKDVFCIWLVSPLLQLQLKDHHQPLRMRMKWPDLLKRFTTASNEMIEKDEPILSFQRNSFFPLQEERKITDEKIIKRLFEEAKHNVLNGFYPLTRKQGEMFGAVLALTEYGKYSPQVHRVGYFRNKLSELVPYWMYKPGWHTILGRSTKATIEQNLIAQYKELSEELDIKSEQSCSNGKLFLERCWDLPYYGSVFFNGQIEKQVSGLTSLLDHPDIPVRVAVNRDAVHVIDPKKNVILLGLSYDEFSWDYSHTPNSESDPECFDTFWLEFDSEDGDSTAITQLQIFSKQAIMIDAMVQSCALGPMTLSPVPEACGSAEPRTPTTPEKNRYKIRNRMERVSISTYDRDETTILEDSTLQDTPDTPRCEDTAQDSQEEEEASTSEQAPSNDHKEKNKKGKSSMKSKEKRPHLKLPKALHRSFSAQSNGNQQAKAISVAVFLVEKVGRLLNLEYGKDTTAGLICKMMVENLTMSSQTKDVFCIWLVSPLLQLQLKDHHQPLRMRMKWPDLLKRFTTASNEMIEKDEPILSFQRNSFFPLQEERKITDEKIIKRLFEEAKHNVLNGFYPLTRKQGEMFGAVLALTEYGKYSPQVHRVGYFKNKLSELVPYWMYKPGWHTILGRSTKATIEQNLIAQFKELSEELDIKSEQSCSNGKHFLERCWDLPYYGRVFFNGQIEKQVSGLTSLLDHPDIPVRVAVSRDTVHVIDPKKNVILLGLSYDEFSWDYSHTPNSESDPECFDTFWLEFDSEEGDSTAITQLQIFSKQAVMIDAMVQSCALGPMTLSPVPEACSSAEPRTPTTPEKNRYKIRNRMERVSISTYDRDGFELHRGRRNNFSITTLFRRQPSVTN